ncbi:type II toxin-antitoxin system PemK/MazF family toxin [Campylobacter sp. VTCC 70190]|uniref:type II toxin-antitoxin system PemK/MazF family toxin n=1 Tax=Campylobacter sp. VTCC 70190 TaxID=3392118 RepID=UPI00398E8A63
MQDENLKFDEWNKLKKETEKTKKKKYIETKKIYWIKIGKNIGSEVFGKGKDFARPVLVINVFYNGSFLGVPLSSKSKNKSGKMYHKFKDDKGNLQVALLGQIRVFDSKRKLELISSIKEIDFTTIKDKIKSIIE